MQKIIHIIKLFTLQAKTISRKLIHQGLQIKNFKKSNIFALNPQKIYISTSLLWKRGVILTWQNIKRNKFLSLITILILSLIVLVFNITFAVNYLANKSIEHISEKIDIIVWIDDNADEFQISSLKTDLERLPEVKKIIYTSKDEALEKFQVSNPEVYTFLKQYRLNNPLPASIGIVANQIEDNLTILNFLKQDLYQNTINQDQIKNNIEAKQRTQTLINITSLIYQSGQYLVSLSLIVVILITMSTINILINRRSQEILIMRLVGAKHYFIRLPFLLEGVLYTLSAFLLGLFLMYLFAHKFQSQLKDALSDDSLLLGFQNIINLFLTHFHTILFYEIIIAIITGMLSSYIAIEWYLKKQNLLSN